jgi:alkyl sulfatase BDS1-like metallo-beta-lactamase superfamily hydrolase
MANQLAPDDREHQPVPRPKPLPASIEKYMGAPVELVTARNGATINKAAMGFPSRGVITLQPTVLEPVPGVHVFAGFSIVNVTVVEGDDGLIAYDTGDNTEEGAHYLAEIRKVSPKPGRAIIYSHSHYVHGAQQIADGDAEVRVIGHLDLNRNLRESGGAGSYFQELAPVQIGRAMEQFNYYLPTEGPDAPIGGTIIQKQSGFLPVNTPVEEGQEMVIAGVRMRFFISHHSDTTDCLSVWLPERKIVLNNLLWPIMPNIYTLRGATFRDPRDWRDGLKQLRDLAPEILISTHALPVTGREASANALTDYMDGLTLVLDQTLRGILHGLGPEELRHFVHYPARLQNSPYLFEGYGKLSYYPPYIYDYALGWFDRDAANINKVPPLEEARRIVEGFGGRAKMLDAVRASLNSREYAWAAQLVNYLYRLAPDDPEARQLKADALRQMGYITTGTIPRSWYLSQARSLEGKVSITRNVPPSGAQIAASPETFVDFHRVRLIPEKSVGVNEVIAFVFADAAGTAALHVRDGVAEFVPIPAMHCLSPAHTVTLRAAVWGRLYRKTRSRSRQPLPRAKRRCRVTRCAPRGCSRCSTHSIRPITWRFPWG